MLPFLAVLHAWLASQCEVTLIAVYMLLVVAQAVLVLTLCGVVYYQFTRLSGHLLGRYTWAYPTTWSPCIILIYAEV